MLTNARPAPPLPLQQQVVESRRLLTVPWAMLLRWLLGEAGVATYAEGTHEERGEFPAAQVRPGTWWYETDRTVLYQARLYQSPADPPDADPVPRWHYVSGTMRETLANKPADLGPSDMLGPPTDDHPTVDIGFLFYATDYAHTWRWTGTAWEYAPGDRPSGEIAWFTADAPAGWALCNGTPVTRSTSLAGTVAFTTPNLIGAYAKGGSVYTGAVVPAGGSVSSGTTGAEAAHTHGVDEAPVWTSGSNEGQITVDHNPAGAYGVARITHLHSVDLPATTTGAGSAHSHSISGLTISGVEPAHVELLPYYRL